MRYFIDRTGLAVGCLGGLEISGLFARAAWGRPEFHWAVTVVPAIAFGAAGLLCGYRLFCPDEWFARRDRREQEWFARHPVIGWIGLALGLLGALMEIIRVCCRFRFP